MARGLPTGGQGSKVYVLCVEPKEYKRFRPGTRPGGSGTRPGGSVTGVTEKLFMCQMLMCLFRPLQKPFPGTQITLHKLLLNCVFPVEPQRPNGKNINLHKKWGFRRFQKECRKVPKSAENRTFCAKSVQKMCKKCGSPHFLALFGTLSEIGGNPTFCAD